MWPTAYIPITVEETCINSHFSGNLVKICATFGHIHIILFTVTVLRAIVLLKLLMLAS